MSTRPLGLGNAAASAGGVSPAPRGSTRGPRTLRFQALTGSGAAEREPQLTTCLVVAKFFPNANIRVQVPQGAPVREVLPDDHQQADRYLPDLRQEGGTPVVGRRRIGL